MQEALELIRREMGPHAVIVSSHNGAKGRVEVTAAVETHQTNPDIVHFSPSPSHLNSREVIQEFFQFCNYHCIPKDIQQEWNHILEHSSCVFPSMRSLINDFFSIDPLRLDNESLEKPFVFVGPFGSGKTSIIGKLAAQCVIQKKSVILATLEPNNAHYLAKIHAYAQALNVPLYTVKTREELREIYKQKEPHTALFVDTYGTNPMKRESLYPIKDIVSAIPAQLVGVFQSNLCMQQLNVYCHNYASIMVSKIFLTGIDMTSTFGTSLLSARQKNMSLCAFSESPMVDQFIKPASYDHFETLFTQIPRGY